MRYAKNVMALAHVPAYPNILVIRTLVVDQNVYPILIVTGTKRVRIINAKILVQEHVA